MVKIVTKTRNIDFSLFKTCQTGNPQSF